MDSESNHSTSSEEVAATGFQAVLTQLRSQAKGKSSKQNESSTTVPGQAAPGKSTDDEDGWTVVSGEDSSSQEVAGDNMLEDSVDRLLDRHRQEIMFELRRMTMGSRPVTGTGNRETIGNFLSQSSETRHQNQRPEAVVVEVQGLVERRPVSSILQSTRFRRNLEASLRGSLVRLSNEVTSARSRTHSPNVTAPQSENVTNHSTVNSQNEATEPMELPSTSSTERAAEWLEQVPQPDRVVPSPSEAWSNLEYAARENLISEISDLVHQQLVTSTLEGPIRNRLERQMRNHLARTEVDNTRVQNFLQNLPRVNHTRNDFSHLGIGNNIAPQSLSDDISVISATAAVHVTQNQQIPAAVNNELRSIKAQMTEMRNMMMRSFDLQLDIQRAIRQEVAAALNSASSSTSAPTPAPMPSSSRGSEFQRTSRGTHCLICLDSETDTVLYRCGHACVCYGCGMELKSRAGHCPVCRAPIQDIIRTYFSNDD